MESQIFWVNEDPSQEPVAISNKTLETPDLAKLGISQKSWDELEQSRQRTTPRFLFRGFHSLSGGGIDPRLNSTTGIVPHGFLHYPTEPWPPHLPPGSMFETRALGSMIDAHLSGQLSKAAQTRFSSWAASISIAAKYARYNTTPHIAVVDTNLLPPYALVYHTPALARAHISTNFYTEEYLIYGPVCGPAFSCVPFSELQAARWWWNGTERRLARAAERVEVARRIARTFARKYNRRAEVVVALTAIIASLGVSSAKVTRSELRREIPKQLMWEITLMRLPAPPEVGLVNPRTYDKGYPEIQQMVSLLMDVEVICLVYMSIAFEKYIAH
ncbi:hypothetical protein F5X96DRAFT_683805 [Biscogniauxia mediterranea]|nr:hypothetical protein F5X96DRAFT_683805 [Biscogniauxia mediterranea]